MSTNLERRLAKEYKELEDGADYKVRLRTPGDPSNLEAALQLPSGMPYSGGAYTIDVQIPSSYPFERPVMKFNSKIWHPNIHLETGEVGTDALGPWDPTHTIKSELESLVDLLKQPNLQYPHNQEALKMFNEDSAGFKCKAQEWAVRFAGAPAADGQSSIVTDTIDPRYEGYHRDMVQRFVDLGFTTEAVVEAFKYVGIDRNNGQDYVIEEAYQGDIAARLYHA
ncbi:unnamed protein product, partial [Fusarium equiseti]